MEEILRITSRVTDVEECLIRSRIRFQEIGEARRMFIYVCYKNGYTVGAISSYLNGMTRQAVAYHIKTMKYHEKIYRSSARSITEIENALH